jgi:hypothetical protein
VLRNSTTQRDVTLINLPLTLPFLISSTYLIFYFFLYHHLGS